jgi:predicted permease
VSTWSAGWRRLLRLWRPNTDADIEAELRFHFEQKVADLVARGATPEMARARAEAEFGDVDAVRGRLREIDGRIAQHRQRAEWWEGVAQDVGHTLRSLRRSPGFTLAVVLCLAIGIGANTTMFGIVDALLLRPPSGVRDPGSLVWIGAEVALPEMFTDMDGVSYPDFVDFSRSPALNGAAAYSVEPRSFGRGTDVQEVNTAVVTHTFMPLLGANPALGHFFGPDEDRPGAAAVVVLGYGFWQRQFGGAADVVGKSVRVGIDTYEVIGVAPRDFNGVERACVDVYLPVGPGNDDLLTNRSNSFLTVIGRLRPGFRVESLADRLNFAYHHAAERTPINDFRKYTTIRVASPMATTAMRSPEQVQNANVSLWLAGVAAVVLLIACANVANLLLARSVHRQRETAVRLVLGVGRGRLVRQLLTESLVLAGAGGVAALFVSRWGGAIVRAMLLPDALVGATPLDVRLLAVTILATVATGLVCGLAPALQATRPNLTTALKAGAREGTEGRGRLRSALLVGQVALTLVLLIGAGLFVRSLNNVRAIDLGYDAERVLNVGVSLPRFNGRVSDRTYAASCNCSSYAAGLT